jgi:trehalose 6-phosphate phosphatase
MSTPPIPERPACFLDFDGVLVAIADTPGGVIVDPGLPDLLDRLADRTDGALAIVTGRTIEDVDRFLAPARLATAGMHGFEHRLADGDAVEGAAPPPELEELRRRLEAYGMFDENVRLEEKRSGLAVHYRAAPDREEEVWAAVGQALEGLESLHAISGKMVVEAKRVGHDKGVAIRKFMAMAPFEGRTPVFLGDDVTDEDGFRVVNDMGGVSIKVGDGDTIARHRLADVGAVHRWLAELADSPDDAMRRAG